MSPKCADETKYGVIDSITQRIESLKNEGQTLLGQAITDVVTINGVRFTLEDGTWGLIRASSNKPTLVVVVESPVSNDQMHAMFDAINDILADFPEVGEYDQKL